MSNSEDERQLMLKEKYKKSHPVNARELDNIPDMNSEFDQFVVENSKDKTMNV